MNMFNFNQYLSLLSFDIIKIILHIPPLKEYTHWEGRLKK